MQMTLREVLQVSVLKDATVVAGTSGLDNIVDSVTTIEVTEDSMVNWVYEKQLYISAMYSVKDDVERQINLIDILHKRKCSGLILCHVGIWMKGIDKRLIAHCDSIGFPLIKANPNTKYIDIIYPILSVTQEDKFKTESSYVNIDAYLLDLIIDADNMEVIYQKISERYNIHYSHYDTYCNCLFSNRTFVKTEADSNYLLNNYNTMFERLLLNEHHYIKSDTGNEVFFLLRTRNMTLGFLCIDVEENDEKRIVQLGKELRTAFALTSSRKTLSVNVHDMIVHEFISDLLIWNFRNPEVAVRRGEDVGIDISRCNCLAVININDMRRSGVKAEKVIGDQLKLNVLHRLTSSLLAVDKGSNVILYSDQILILLNERNSNKKIISILEECYHIFSVRGISVSIGVSNSFDQVNNIPEAYRQACEAYLKGQENDTVMTYKDIFFIDAIRRLLYKNQSATECAYSILQPLKEHDERYNAELCDTLKELLHANGDVTKVSERMFTHRNTIIYRRKKIVEVLGKSPFEMPRRLNYMIAFCIIEKK